MSREALAAWEVKAFFKDNDKRRRRDDSSDISQGNISVSAKGFRTRKRHTPPADGESTEESDKVLE